MYRYLNIREVAERYGISRSTVERYVKSGAIPEPVRLGGRTIRWRSDVLDRHDDELQNINGNKELRHG